MSSGLTAVRAAGLVFAIALVASCAPPAAGGAGSGRDGSSPGLDAGSARLDGRAPTAKPDARDDEAPSPVDAARPADPGRDAPGPPPDAQHARADVADSAAPGGAEAGAPAGGLRHVIIDSDANNEIDDQHAIAYALFHDGISRTIDGITTNYTVGGSVQNDTKEAERIVKLCGSKVKVYTGANGTFEGIGKNLAGAFDGQAAVNFLIERALARSPADKLHIVAIGKLTNVALALKKEPKIAANVRVTWLGSNYPARGEHNEKHDEPAVNFVFDTDVELEVALVRFTPEYENSKEEGGTVQVMVAINDHIPAINGQGPVVPAVEGRHGGSFTRFGDYSVDLFRKILGESGARWMFDVAAVAVAKTPTLSRAMSQPAPRIGASRWEERPDNPRKVTFRMKFQSDNIMNDFYKSVRDASKRPLN